MIRPALRVYSGPQEDTDTTVLASRRPRMRTVTVRAGEILSTLAEAIQHQQAWVEDFQDDPMTISADLYDVILAYQNLRPSA
jgi:hypothetical protein